MKIHYSPDRMTLTIEGVYRAQWLNGSDLYYAMPKDHRPEEVSPFDLDDSLQSYYRLYRVAKDSFDINEVPEDIRDAIRSLKDLADILNAYSSHILGLLCRPQYGEFGSKGVDNPTPAGRP